MATAYGGEASRNYSWGTGKSRAWVEATVSNKSDTVATVTVRGQIQSVSPYSISGYGERVHAGVYNVGASGYRSVSALASFDYSAWVPTSPVAGSWDFPRKEQAYNVTAFTWYYGESDGYHSAGAWTGEVQVSVTVPALPVYTPRPVGNVASVRESDTRNTVSWENDPDATHPYSSIKIERMIDSGQWSEVASLSGSATSYVDTSTSANHIYRYRVRPVNSAGAGDWAVTGYTYNTPAAPAKVTASRKTGTTVALSIDNPANTATALELQRSGDGAAWEAVKNVDGSPVTDAEDSPGGGTWYYRARNTRGSLVSDWSPASNAVVTIAPPSAPTLAEPASGVTVSKAQDAVRFAWAHNPVDGSAQTAAQLQTSTDGGTTWATAQITGAAQEKELANSFAINSTVTWRVRTKGAHADYGPWSANRVFTVCQQPSVSFALPVSGAVIENTPVRVSLDYSDPSGSLAAAYLEALHDGGVVYAKDMGASTEASVPAAEWLPVNGETYTLSVTVRSTSTLQASARREVSVDFVPPMDGVLSIEPDIETGYCSVTASVELDEEKAGVESLSVYRVRNGVRKLLADNLQIGDSIMDKYAPVNVDFVYEVVSFADSGIYSTVPFPARIDSPWFFFYWGNEIAKAKWNPEGEKSLSRPRKKRVYYAGRRYPVSYDSNHVSDERSLSAVLMSADEARAFERLVEDGGRCVYKNGNGDVIRCDVEATLTPDWQAPAYYGGVSVSIVRIDGGDL